MTDPATHTTDTTGTTTDTVRIASYNLHDLKDDVAAATRVVRAIDPDVLLVQEVPRHPLSGYRIRRLAAACSLYWSGGHRGGGGTTVLTSLRVDALDVAHRALPVRAFQRSRGYAVARVRKPGHRPVTAVSIHLGLDADERVRHVRTVLDSLDSADSSNSLDSLGPGRRLVVGGDLNEGPDGRAWRLVAHRVGAAVTGPEPTYRSTNPRRRIDAIFGRPPLTPLPGAPVALREADVVAASDHRPVCADVGGW